MNWINKELNRKLKKGAEYEGLIPKYQGVKHNFETSNQLSDTYETLQYMANWVKKYHSQMTHVAKKLKRSTTQQTVNAIYEFLYWHFQYKLDESLQQLYSPSAAWHFRKTGFDCKTFSLLASCILTELKLDHSFRKVKQASIMPGMWSHVYVVVHDKGIDRVIDATKKTNTEVSYLQKFDFKMQNLKHIGLAAPGRMPVVSYAKPAFNGLGSGTTARGIGYAKPMGLGSTSFSSMVGSLNISNLFGNIDCTLAINSSLNPKRLKGYLTNVEAYYKDLFAKLNMAVNEKNATQVSNLVAEFFGNSAMFEAASIKNRSKGWNACTSQNIDVATKTFNFYKVTVGAALQAWITDNFMFSQSGKSVSFSSDGAETKYGFAHLNNNPHIVISQPVLNFTFKDKNIPAFQMTAYMQQLADLHSKNKTTSFNAQQFLSGLTTVVGAFTPTSQTGDYPIYNNPNNPKNPAKPNSTSSKSIVTPVVVGASALAAIFFLAPKFKDNIPNAKK